MAAQLRDGARGRGAGRFTPAFDQPSLCLAVRRVPGDDTIARFLGLFPAPAEGGAPAQHCDSLVDIQVAILPPRAIRTVRKLEHLTQPLKRQPHLGCLAIVDAIDEGDAHVRLHNGAGDELDALGELLHGAVGSARCPGRVEGGEQELSREAIEAQVLRQAEEDGAVREAVLKGHIARFELAEGIVHLVVAVHQVARVIEVVAVSDAEVAPQTFHPDRVNAVVHRLGE
eukprot:scaffold25518_cov74-Phaeocystis_antarctica.AAC.3